MSAFKKRSVDGKAYNFDSNLKSEIKAFRADKKIDRRENEKLGRILDYNKKKNREQLVLRKTTRSKLLLLRETIWINRHVKSRINDILSQNSQGRKTKETISKKSKSLSQQSRKQEYTNSSSGDKVLKGVSNKRLDQIITPAETKSFSITLSKNSIYKSSMDGKTYDVVWGKDRKTGRETYVFASGRLKWLRVQVSDGDILKNIVPVKKETEEVTKVAPKDRPDLQEENPIVEESSEELPWNLAPEVPVIEEELTPLEDHHTIAKQELEPSTETPEDESSSEVDSGEPNLSEENLKNLWAHPTQEVSVVEAPIESETLVLEEDTSRLEWGKTLDPSDFATIEERMSTDFETRNALGFTDEEFQELKAEVKQSPEYKESRIEARKLKKTEIQNLQRATGSDIDGGYGVETYLYYNHSALKKAGFSMTEVAKLKKVVDKEAEENIVENIISAYKTDDESADFFGDDIRAIFSELSVGDWFNYEPNIGVMKLFDHETQESYEYSVAEGIFGTIESVFTTEPIEWGKIFSTIDRIKNPQERTAYIERVIDYIREHDAHEVARSIFTTIQEGSSTYSMNFEGIRELSVKIKATDVFGDQRFLLHEWTYYALEWDDFMPITGWKRLVIRSDTQVSLLDPETITKLEKNAEIRENIQNNLESVIRSQDIESILSYVATASSSEKRRLISKIKETVFEERLFFQMRTMFTRQSGGGFVFEWHNEAPWVNKLFTKELTAFDIFGDYAKLSVGGKEYTWERYTQYYNGSSRLRIGGENAEPIMLVIDSKRSEENFKKLIDGVSIPNYLSENPRNKVGWKEAGELLGIGHHFRLTSTYAKIKWIQEDGSSRARKRTWLDQLRKATIAGALVLRKYVKWTMTITWGTEKGHSGSLRLSHYDGEKLDFSSERPLLDFLAKMKKRRSFPLGSRLTLVLDGYRMKFWRHGPKDHVDVSFEKV